jgi:hypothetical protein
MAADSRLTLTFPDPNFSDPKNPGAKHFISVPQSDSTQKLFLALDRIGISTCGNATVGNVPISGFIASFIRTLPEGVSVEDAAEALLQHFVKIDPKLVTWFHVAGYSDSGTEMLTELWFVSIATNQKNLSIGRGQQDARWNGELDILQRVFLPVYLQDQNGKYQPVLHPGIAVGHLTLQDAVALAVFGVRTTIELMNFQATLRTVGGPVDVLVIKPEGSQWLSQKHLYVPGSSPFSAATQAQPLQKSRLISEGAVDSTKSRIRAHRGSSMRVLGRRIRP